MELNTSPLKVSLYKLYFIVSFLIITGCSSHEKKDERSGLLKIKPLFVTEPVKYDSDDPAIWVNKNNLPGSLILGTDKHEGDGAVYAFNLEGKIQRSVRGIDRPNNIDVAYDFVFGTDTTDIAVFTERMKSVIRVMKIPEMEFIDNGGIPVFEETEYKQPMGLALYTRPEDNKIFAIVSRKENPENNNDYLWQYELMGSDTAVNGKLVRKFGVYEGNEVEAVAIDNELGYIYYSDETFGIRKYFADPGKSNNQELAVFGTEGFEDDHEGISIYKKNDTAGYILVSDQQANEFHIFSREGSAQNPHNHQLVKEVKLSTLDSDGSEITQLPLNENFPKGMFVAMSDDKTFQIYSVADILGE